MPTHIHEANMRRQIRIRQRSRFLDIAAFAYSRHDAHHAQQHVHCRCGLWPRALTKVNCAKRMILRQACSRASTIPGAEIEPVTNAIPTGKMSAEGATSPPDQPKNYGGLGYRSKAGNSIVF